MAARASLLERLIPELQLMIFDNLDYIDAIKLSQVNRNLHSVVNPQRWPVATKSSNVNDAQKWQRYNLYRSPVDTWFPDSMTFVAVSNGFACYTCFKVKQKTAFSINQTERESGKFKDRQQRFCLDCGVERGIYRPGMLAHPRMDVGHFSETGHLLALQIMCEHCEAFRLFGDSEEIKMFMAAGEAESPCVKCCEAKGKEVKPCRALKLICQTCKNSKVFPVNRFLGACISCNERICTECGKTRNGPMAFCSQSCKKASRKGFHLLKKECRRPWKFQKSDLGGAEDVLEAELEDALRILEL